MDGQPVILDYGTQRPNLPAPVPLMAWQCPVAVFLDGLFLPSISCLCGHLDIMGFMVTAPAAALAWWGFTRRVSWFGRFCAIGAVAMATFQFGKNILDICWFGHSPLFR